MAREFMCEYGNCEETQTPIRVNISDRQERARFCCLEHAGLWLLRQSWMLEGSRDEFTSQRLANALHHDLRR